MRIDEMDQHPATLDMAEEAVADPGTVGSALDQAGDIGDDEFAALVSDDAKLRAQRREGIGADLCLGIGNAVDEGRLARIGEADQADVGEQLQAQPDPHFLARPTRLMLARGAIDRAFIARIAAPAVAAAQQPDALSDAGEVDDQAAVLVVGKHLRADRNLDDQIVAARTGTVAAHAALAARCLEMLRIAKIDQRVEALDRLENDIAALAAIAAVGAAILNVFFAAERHGAAAARAGAHVYLGLIEKMHGRAFRPSGSL